MKAVIALDLDQTMIYSHHSAGLLDGIETVWVEELDGAPLSLMSLAAHEAVVALSQRHHVVPVTTRTPEQLARVRFPGTRTHAICANGGVLIVDGVRDRRWDARVRRELSSVLPAAQVLARVDTAAPWMRTVRQVEDLFVYVVAHARELIPDGWLSDVGSWAVAHGWSVSQQGRKVYLVPDGLEKGSAAVRVAEVLGGPLLAAGDSVLDADLLEAAVVAVRPAHGELHEVPYPFKADVRVSAVSGVRASEEILAVLGREADGLVSAPR